MQTHDYDRTFEQVFVRTDGEEAIAGNWLTYQQAGNRLGISAEAARQRARRLHWPHRATGVNEGGPKRTLILVPDVEPKPVQELGQASAQTPVQPDGRTLVRLGQAHSLSGETAALLALVDVLRDQLAKAEARATEDRQQLRAEQERATMAENQVRELRHTLDTEIVALRANLAIVQAPIPTISVSKARRSAWRRWLSLS